MSMLPMEGLPPIKVKYLGLRSYTGNSATTISQVWFETEGRTHVKVGSRDSGLTSAVVMFYDSSFARISQESIPTTGGEWVTPTNTVYVVFQGTRSTASGTSVYYIQDMEIY